MPAKDIVCPNNTAQPATGKRVLALGWSDLSDKSDLSDLSDLYQVQSKKSCIFLRFALDKSGFFLYSYSDT